VVVLILGLILGLLGLIPNVGILWAIGLVLTVIGSVLWIAGSAGHGVAGRRHSW
jgi:hypothetical protein